MRSILTAALLAATLLVLPARAATLLLVSDADFAPYSMRVEGKPSGIDVEVLTEAARRAGVPVEIRLRSWDELVSMVDSGKCDGAFSLFMNPERQKTAMYLEGVPVHYSDYVLFTLVGTRFPFRSYDDLSDKIIGKAKGAALGEEFDKARAAGMMKVVDFDDLSGGMRALVGGDIDAYAGNIDVTYNRLKTMGMTSSIVYLPKKILAQKPSFLVMSRKSTVADKELLFQKLERALDSMRKDGTYNTIARRYLIRY